MGRPFSSYNRFFYILSKGVHQLVRYARWHTDGRAYAHMRDSQPLPAGVHRHQSMLVRRLGDVDVQLQLNKVTNINLAIGRLNGILIGPGEVFSFWRLVGSATGRKGYLTGMLLRNGEAIDGVGGGLCQIANLIHWLALHSPLTVTEHHHHSFDPFPDSGRVVPFGTGATLFYNYLDYQLTNHTGDTFQLNFWTDDAYLHGDLRVSRALPYSYHVYEENHAFLKIDGRIYRQNEIWRRKTPLPGSGDAPERELIRKNFSLVKYTPQDYIIEVPQGHWHMYPIE